jgi:hypothetical protein
MRGDRRFGAFLLLFALWLPASASQASPSPFSTSSFLNIYQITSNGQQLYVARYGEVDYSVDTSGLYIDVTCAQNAQLSTVDNIRIDLLRQGCARITGTPLDSAEEAAQAQAKAAHVGLWSQPRSGVGRVAEWAKKHQLISASTLVLVLAVVGCVPLIKLIGWLVALFYRRKVDVIIAGTPAAGKTGLWTEWKDYYSSGTSGQISNLPVTSGVHKTPVEPIMLEKWTLQPTLVDIGGAEPWHVLEGIQGPRGLRGAIRRKRKRVLLYVVAPCAEETVSGQPINETYVAKQAGYSYFPVAIIKQPAAKVRPDSVIMFATKFDLLSAISPGDSNGNEAEKIASTFKEHHDLVKNACETSKVPFTWIIGSAKRGWGIEQLRKSVEKVMM